MTSHSMAVYYDKMNLSPMAQPYRASYPSVNPGCTRWRPQPHRADGPARVTPGYAGNSSHQWCYSAVQNTTTHHGYYANPAACQPSHHPSYHHPHPNFQSPLNYGYQMNPPMPCNSIAHSHLANPITIPASRQSKRIEIKAPPTHHQTWSQSKPNLTRHNSDDSGIAVSPGSITSSVTSNDESPIDSAEEKETNSVKSENTTESATENIETVKVENCETEKFYTLDKDKRYWERVNKQPPTDHVIKAIVDQIEYYMSDEYLLKDKYLLRQIRCKKDGYVSLKLITSFKKVKKLARDWAVVRSALVRKSTELVISSEGLRVKRRKQLSDTLRKPMPLTSVLVIRLPEEYNTVKPVISLFRGFGEIALVRLLRSDQSVPPDLRNYATQVPDIGKSLCAVVEFESANNALEAVRVLNYVQRQPSDLEDNEENAQTIKDFKDTLKKSPALQDMRLALLGPRVRRTLYRQDRTTDDVTDAATSNNESDADDRDEITNLKSEKNSKQRGEERSTSSAHSAATKPNFLWRRASLTPSNGGVKVVRQPRGPPVDGKNFTPRKN